MKQGGAAVARVAHNHEAGGSNPPPATNSNTRCHAPWLATVRAGLPSQRPPALLTAES